MLKNLQLGIILVLLSLKKERWMLQLNLSLKQLNLSPQQSIIIIEGQLFSMISRFHLLLKILTLQFNSILMVTPRFILIEVMHYFLRIDSKKRSKTTIRLPKQLLRTLSTTMQKELCLRLWQLRQKRSMASKRDLTQTSLMSN